ncbi:SdpI family protein [Actinoalloteichus spitiensis]|uniref:SdpI family protein n=1 Tax=Actinoalloteichus spitiensis TaxID=252394 RepID=UPI00037C072B|nr:SdpI family protein [Actinoalloteichus spitiensis]
MTTVLESGQVLAAQAEAGGITVPRILLMLVMVAAGVAVGFVGLRGLREALPKNSWAGVQTPATMRSDEAFRVGNKAAGLPLLVAGAVLALLGALVPFAGGTATVVTLGVVGGLGGLALTAAGCLLGHQAASRVPAPKPQGRRLGCSGQCCGNSACGVASALGGATAPGSAS